MSADDQDDTQHAPLCGWENQAHTALNNMRVMPPPARKALLDMVLQAFCPMCGVQKHPLIQTCPCIVASAS